MFERLCSEGDGYRGLGTDQKNGGDLPWPDIAKGRDGLVCQGSQEMGDEMGWELLTDESEDILIFVGISRL